MVLSLAGIPLTAGFIGVIHFHQRSRRTGMVVGRCCDRGQSDGAYLLPESTVGLYLPVPAEQTTEFTEVKPYLLILLGAVAFWSSGWARIRSQSWNWHMR